MFKDSSITNNITVSLQHFLSDLFVKDGAYFDISGTSGYYGNLSNLTQINLPQYASGRVWSARRQNWMWESGISISGVWVNNNLLTSGFKLNYQNGYVVFDNPVSGTVRLNYSSRLVEVRTDGFYLRGDPDSFNLQDKFFINGSGFSYQNKIQLPCVSLIEGPVSSSPYEIGSTTKIKEHIYIVHVLSDEISINSKIRDRIQALEETYVKIFDVEESKRSGVYPLSKDGFLLNYSGTYGFLAENFKFSQTRSDIFVLSAKDEGSNILPNGLYHGKLKITLESILSV